MKDATKSGGSGKDEAGAEPPSLEEFSHRLERASGAPAVEPGKGSGAAWGRAMRVSSELLAGLFVGALIGVLLDRWLETAPLFLLLGLGFGFAAGVRNLARSLKENESSSGD